MTQEDLGLIHRAEQAIKRLERIMQLEKEYKEKNLVPRDRPAHFSEAMPTQKRGRRPYYQKRSGPYLADATRGSSSDDFNDQYAHKHLRRG